MPVNTAVVGCTTDPVIHEVDERWIMAYSASLGDIQACYLDTTRETGIVAHPLFAICPEWPAIEASRALLQPRGLLADERNRVVHGTHDVQIHRLIRPTDRLRSQATVVSVEAKAPGALTLVRIDTRDENGHPVATTIQGHVYRDVAVVGEPQPACAEIPPRPVRISDRLARFGTFSHPIGANAAHLYTECARIWNPVHTDVAVAKAAGLPDIILHGSATLALAVSNIVEQLGGGEPRRVRRIYGNFRGMVLMPSTIHVNVYAPDERADGVDVRFEVVNAEGQAAVADGLVTLTNAL